MTIPAEPFADVSNARLPADLAAKRNSAPGPRARSKPLLTDFPRRPAWVEIDLSKLRGNFELINLDKPAQCQVLAVVKDDGYGHGSLSVARTALEFGARFLALSTLEEAIALRDQGLNCRLLLLGDRQENELSWCVAHDLTCCVSELHTVK